jgi:hypothetical protein
MGGKIVGATTNSVEMTASPARFCQGLATRLFDHELFDFGHFDRIFLVTPLE